MSGELSIPRSRQSLGLVVRPYPPDKMMVDFYKHGQKLILASSLSVEWPIVHIQCAGAGKAWSLPVPKLIM